MYFFKRHARGYISSCGPLSRIVLPIINIDEERIHLEDTFSEYVSNALPVHSEKDLKDVWLLHKKISEYNIRSGPHENFSGLTALLAYKSFAVSNGPIDPYEIHLARIMAWNVKMLVAYIVINDDIQDDSFTRKGKLCWHHQEGVGLRAISDASLLYFGIYTILKKYFSEKPYYVPIMELFNKTVMKTTLGQIADASSRQPDDFTMEKWKTVCNYKNIIACYLPVAAGLCMAGIPLAIMKRGLGRILDNLGMLLQILNDFTDIYSDADVTGKVATDIGNGTCTWLSVLAMSNANAEQKRVIKENYGRGTENCVKIVRDVYDDLHMKKLFCYSLIELYNDILEQIGNLESLQEKQIASQILKHFLDVHGLPEYLTEDSLSKISLTIFEL